jgi:hypothetical protein
MMMHAARRDEPEAPRKSAARSRKDAEGKVETRYTVGLAPNLANKVERYARTRVFRKMEE